MIPRTSRSTLVSERDEEILVVAVDSVGEFRVVDEGHFYRYPRFGHFPKRQARYLAVYRAIPAGNPGIEYVARIQAYQFVKRQTLAREIVKYIPDYNTTRSGELVKVLLGPLIRLHHRIINPKGTRIAYRYTTFDKLLTAETVDEL